MFVEHCHYAAFNSLSFYDNLIDRHVPSVGFGTFCRCISSQFSADSSVESRLSQITALFRVLALCNDRFYSHGMVDRSINLDSPGILCSVYSKFPSPLCCSNLYDY